MNVIERNELVENYLPLAKKLAFQFKKRLPKKVDIEEIQSAAYLGLVDAARKFNPAKAISFGAYAKFRIMGEIQDFIRESYRNDSRYGISLDQPDDSGHSMAGNIPQGQPANFDEFFENITKRLNGLDKEIVVLYYIENFSLREIGKKFGVSESRVSQLLKRSRESMKEMAA